jgi:hypothetical protein
MCCALKKGGGKMGMLAKHARSLLLLGALLTSVLVGAGVAAAVEVGEKAPDFNLPSTTGKNISLSHFLGKHLLLIQFYKTDFNPT